MKAEDVVVWRPIERREGWHLRQHKGKLVRHKQFRRNAGRAKMSLSLASSTFSLIHLIWRSIPGLKHQTFQTTASKDFKTSETKHFEMRIGQLYALC